MKAGRAGSAIEVFISAADREVGLRPMQVDRHGAGRMGQVPDGQRALGVGVGCQARHVVQVAGAVVDVGQHDDRRVAVDGGRQFLRRIDQACTR